jgi:hypothetical protein
VTWPLPADTLARDDSEKAFDRMPQEFDASPPQRPTVYQMSYPSMGVPQTYDHPIMVMGPPLAPPVPIGEYYDFAQDPDPPLSVASPYDHPAMIRIGASTPVQRSSTPVSLTPGGNPTRSRQTALPTMPAPTPPVRAPEGAVAPVVAEFIPSLSDELRIQIGEIVRIFAIYDDGWVFCGKVDSKSQGMIPAECLDLRGTGVDDNSTRKASVKRAGSLNSRR